MCQLRSSCAAVHVLKCTCPQRSLHNSGSSEDAQDSIVYTFLLVCMDVLAVLAGLLCGSGRAAGRAWHPLPGHQGHGRYMHMAIKDMAGVRRRRRSCVFRVYMCGRKLPLKHDCEAWEVCDATQNACSAQRMRGAWGICACTT
eukprot:1160599-Pelagomonas_calceolata.AAC.14